MPLPADSPSTRKGEAMYSSLIGKIEKAKRYVQEPERINIKHLSATFRGDHSNYEVSYEPTGWTCTCSFFIGHGTCSHTMTIQRTLAGCSPSEMHLQR